jgi:iron complex outermembrane receptor protein
MKTRYFLHLLLASPAIAQSTDSIPKQLDELVVTASPLERTLFELVQPATVLKDKELTLALAPTLGETLARQPGVSSTSFAPGASRPIIRGLGEDRLRVLQNGTSVLDVSNVSPDHAVAADPLAVRSVEVVRGPATLLYGPNTVGGVVNIIDDRLPQERITGVDGSFDTRYGSVDNLRSLSGAVNFGAGPLVFHLDAFTRETDDLEIPGYARSKRLREIDPQPDEARDSVPNSFSESDGGGAGVSYIWDKGFIGLSYSGMDSFYGAVAEEDVTIDLNQRRWDLRGAFREPADWIREVNFKLGYSDYEHTEFEGSEVGTRFMIDGFNGRTELLHEAVNGFLGAVGYEIQHNDFSALGDEAFLPPVENRVNSLFVFEEREFDNFTVQVGGRYDYQTNETAASSGFGPGLERDFNAFSTSAGVVYNPTEDYAVSLSLGYSQRPPTYVELFANGPHVATGAIEIGDADLKTEDSLSLDLSLRKNTGRVTGSVSGFYYRFSDFVSLQRTGFDVVEDLPIYSYQAIGADFFGGEIETTFHLLEPITEPVDAKSPPATTPAQQLDLTFRADYVHAEDRDSEEAVPRIPPFRATAVLDYQLGNFGANFETQWSARQNRTSDDELPTDSYVLVNAGIDYKLTVGEVNTTFFLKGVNLFDQEARQSTSFLKDIVPLAGRGVVIGLRSEF